MKIAVIGGGLTGCLAALELAERGHSVVIFDRENDLLLRASTANEGKIHLGYVYAADASFRTAERLIDDALMFNSILERWMSPLTFEACLVDTFQYIVPCDSNLSVGQIKHHFKRVETRIKERKRQLNLTYLGQTETPRYKICSTPTSPGAVCFKTQERGVWPRGIAKSIRDLVASHPRVQTITNARVRCAERRATKWQIVFAETERKPDGPFEIVVNAAWADRRSIDRRSGFPSSEAWFTRYKFGVLLENASRIFEGAPPMNTTATSGSYGDSVYFKQDDSLYCSWYPVGMCFSTLEEFSDAGLPLPEEPEQLMRKTWKGYATIDPAYRRLGELSSPLGGRLIGDLIIAKGRSDIDDPLSGLHRRDDHGPRELSEGYWSIETGKYTSTARCAVQCVEAILEKP